MKLPILALLILSGASVVSALSNVPAFDAETRASTILGGWRIADGPAMYDRGAYDFQRGYGFLFADALVSSQTEGRGELASSEVSAARAREAMDAFEAAVSLDPGNAHAWTYMSRAYARVAQIEAALAALRASWALAPYNRHLANIRVDLVGILTMPIFGFPDLPPEDVAALQRDMETLNRFSKRTLNFHVEMRPHLLDIVPAITPLAKGDQ